jgi:putative flippase GtrA
VTLSTDGLLQLVRYGLVGVVTNVLLFAGYLLLSTFGVGAKTAMSLLYVPGVLVGFLGNRTFTFGHEGRIPSSLVRYFATYAFGYAFSFASLVVFVDILHWPTDFVVLALIFVTAGMLFLLQRWWVFPRGTRTAPAGQ